MPELPEVEVVRAGLQRHVTGARIDGVEVSHPRPLRRDPRGSDGFVAALVGHRIEAVRRRGLARLLVAAIERSAAEAGRKRLILETGLRQPEAVAMYRALGYRSVAPFGCYADAEGSLHLGKELRSDER